ncbi:hypothetical protein QN277_008973 [Acacia crassicarpa]|uniref:Uncharacterized protein n=1 Tax=Acacia crassicarpa TaxID=499986 RepID=A0AAE1M7Z2_9FABA|nr:hypothetical protein QN277_008973 [Acacia crassicarpa]
MSTLQGALERSSAEDSDPPEGLHRRSPGSPLAIGEQPRDTESEEPRDTDVKELRDTEIEEPGEKRGFEEELNQAIFFNNWRKAKEILDENPNALTARIDSERKTALHLVAQYGYITMVEELLSLLPPKFLETRDSEGFTALGLACWYNGNTHIAKCLVNKNSRILAIPNKRDELPVTVAFANNFQEMGRYLYSVTPFDECLKGCPGSKLICHFLQAQRFDIALNLLQHHEELLFVHEDFFETVAPICLIATLNTVILSPSELTFWKRWIYNCQYQNT